MQVGWGLAAPAARRQCPNFTGPARLKPLMHTRFILVRPSHAGNVGAAARALRVMGFDDLVLVAPRWTNVLRRQETIQRASGALDVLAKARIVATLDEAIEGVEHLCATAMTPRDFGPPTHEPRGYLGSLLKLEHDTEQTRLLPVSVGFIFGSERFGLANEDVYRCHVALSIPTAPDYGSLNLAAAIQVIAYEWRLALGGFGSSQAPAARPTGSADSPRADAAQVAGMLAHWEQALVAIGFLDPHAPKKLMPRLQQLFNRADLRVEEIHILRGVAKAMLEARAGGAVSAVRGSKD